MLGPSPRAGEKAVGQQDRARGATTVADIPEVAAQWHPDNPRSPERSQLRRSSGARPAHFFGSARLALAMHHGQRGPRTEFRKAPAVPFARSSSSSPTSWR